MIAWLKLCAGATVSKASKLFIAIFLVGLTVLVFAQENFSHQFKALRVPQGQIITLSLAFNPSTGFSWQLVKISDKKVLEFVKKEYVPVSGERIGSPGVEKWSFKTLRRGQAEVVLEYRRPWEKDVPAEKKEEYSIFVR
ncbi:MAG: hypothetical protein COV71_05925 [Candidatus Omnitrophica bacterium CG11_big_fil_rev_8_21_14_0_20_41_12]|nr:MAG: hypothetical protein COV71_05925 [Candidatus Omnitrophica bacterium CG11_big_fil_rev_8_21_14_0_20_41_12]